MKKPKGLPEWFSLQNYDETKFLTPLEWYENLHKTSAPGFFAKAEMGSIRFQRRKIFLAVIAFGGPRSSCSGRGAQLPFGTLCTTGLRK